MFFPDFILIPSLSLSQSSHLSAWVIDGYEISSYDAFSCLEDSYTNGKNIKMNEPTIQVQTEPQPVKQEVNQTQSMFLPEKQKILSQTSSDK